MALQGTLDTFALPDVLRLLATTQKTGQLLVQGDQGNGSLYLDGGGVVGGETSLAETDEAHEVLFELLRLDDGSFMFDQSATAPDPGAAVDVESVIDAAESAHTEWQDLSTVVPSLDVGIVLADDLPGDEATITSDRWKLVVAIGSGTTVRDLGERLDLRELPVLRAARGLVDDGLAVIDDGPIAAAPAARVDSGPAGSDDPLPSLDDEPLSGDLFSDGEVDDELPEPLPSGADEAVNGFGATDGVADLEATDAARLEQQMSDLPDDQRDLIERAAEAASPDEAEELLDELPDGAIDRDLMRRFLGSVRS